MARKIVGLKYARIRSSVKMAAYQNDLPPMIERIERALLLLAYFIELDGDIHLPMYEKFEAELNDLKNKRDTKARARNLLLSYSEAGGLKAIR
jgi:hypothetical protein